MMRMTGLITIKPINSLEGRIGYKRKTPQNKNRCQFFDSKWRHRRIYIYIYTVKPLQKKVAAESFRILAATGADANIAPGNGSFVGSKPINATACELLPKNVSLH